MGWKGYRAESRRDYGSESGTIDLERLRVGALMRIADAAEKVAEGYETLTRQRDFYKQRAKEETEAGERLARQVRALRGVITRMKRRQ